MEQSDAGAIALEGNPERESRLRVPAWLSGALLILGATFVLGFYLPLRSANARKAEQLESVAKEYHLATAAFETASEKLATVGRERDGLKKRLGVIFDAESSAQNALDALYEHVSEALKLQSEREQLRVEKGERSVSIVMDALHLVYPHKTFVHARGAELLCQVARAIPKVTGAPSQVVAHANGAEPSSRLLQKQYAKSWQLSAVMASEVAAEIENCGIAGTALRAVGAAHFEGKPREARKSAVRFEILIYPNDN